MISPARSISLKILHRIEAERVFSDDALNSPEMERLGLRDRHLTTEIVYGTLRWRQALDYMLADKSTHPWDKVDPKARTILRMSLYQMWKLSRIPDHAIVNDAVEMTKRRVGKGVDRYVNGMLRHFSRNRPWERDSFLHKAPGWVRVSLPQWLYERWAARYGVRPAEEYALSLNAAPAAAFRRGEEEGSAENQGAMPSDLVPGAYIQAESRNGSENVTQARRYQDEASQLIPHLLGPIGPTEHLWDACAAPGGKSAILQEMAGSRGTVVSSDISWERSMRMRKRLGDDEVFPAMIVADARRHAPFLIRFDAILADVPCSGLGTLRRNPEIKWNFRQENLAELSQTQARILENVADAVKVGGRLLYSTCSTEPEENEQVVASFLRRHPEFCLKAPEYPRGVGEYVDTSGCLRTFPSCRLWDGFYAALMTRRR